MNDHWAWIFLAYWIKGSLKYALILLISGVGRMALRLSKNKHLMISLLSLKTSALN